MIEELQIRPRATTRFWWCGAFTCRAQRINGTGINGQNLLNTNLVQPMRVEIVLVHKALTGAKTKVGQLHCGRIIVKAHAAHMGNAVFLAVNTETMQMVITSVKGDLQSVV